MPNLPRRGFTKRTLAASPKLAKDRSDLEAELVRAEEGWLALSQEYEAAIAS